MPREKRPNFDEMGQAEKGHEKPKAPERRLSWNEVEQIHEEQEMARSRQRRIDELLKLVARLEAARGLEDRRFKLIDREQQKNPVRLQLYAAELVSHGQDFSGVDAPTTDLEKEITDLKQQLQVVRDTKPGIVFNRPGTLKQREESLVAEIQKKGLKISGRMDARRLRDQEALNEKLVREDISTILTILSGIGKRIAMDDESPGEASVGAIITETKARIEELQETQAKSRAAQQMADKKTVGVFDVLPKK